MGCASLGPRGYIYHFSVVSCGDGAATKRCKHVRAGGGVEGSAAYGRMRAGSRYSLSADPYMLPLFLECLVDLWMDVMTTPRTFRDRPNENTVVGIA